MTRQCLHIDRLHVRVLKIRSIILDLKPSNLIMSGEQSRLNSSKPVKSPRHSQTMYDELRVRLCSTEYSRCLRTPYLVSVEHDLSPFISECSNIPEFLTTRDFAIVLIFEIRNGIPQPKWVVWNVPLSSSGLGVEYLGQTHKMAVFLQSIVSNSW
jgi:hypothetical protein